MDQSIWRSGFWRGTLQSMNRALQSPHFSRFVALALAVLCSVASAWRAVANWPQPSAHAETAATAASANASESVRSTATGNERSFVKALPPSPAVQPLLLQLADGSAKHGVVLLNLQSAEHLATVSTLGHTDVTLQLQAKRYADLNAVLSEALAAVPNGVLQRLAIRWSPGGEAVEATVLLTLLSQPLFAQKVNP